MNRTPVVFLILCCITVAGCLPSSCKRIESRELFAADSLSRQLAALIPEDTLTLNGLSFGPEESQLEYPRSILFDSNGHLWIGDVEKGNVLVLDGEGVVLRTVSATFELPFVVGADADTVFVFDASLNSVSTVHDTTVLSTTNLSGYDIPENSVRYMSVTDSGFVLKIVPKEGSSELVYYDSGGEQSSRVSLPGPAWQWAGFMRTTDEGIASLRGYQPRIDLVGTDGRLDSLNLVGFDSPMLARMRSYLRGDANAPPLLTPSAVLAANRIFVLNIRPGWTRIDVYNDDGRLTDILIREKPSFNKDFFPTDIAVTRLTEQSFLIAVAYVEPDGRIEMYEWTDNAN
ncbi:MAG: hypothetical protein HKN43_15705 [Rhodothermales bacterium]|nr:hypothetical protein [Rhodothermales bacterium]